LPILTVLGDSFPNRVAPSLLYSIIENKNYKTFENNDNNNDHKVIENSNTNNKNNIVDSFQNDKIIQNKNVKFDFTTSNNEKNILNNLIFYSYKDYENYAVKLCSKKFKKVAEIIKLKIIYAVYLKIGLFDTNENVKKLFKKFNVISEFSVVKNNNLFNFLYKKIPNVF
jgi:hypothetical protein